MNRDPFNVRRSPLPAFQLLRNGADTLQRTASQASQRIVSVIGEADDIGQKKKLDDEAETVLEDNRASTMSYALPQNGTTQRHPDQWSRGGVAEGGIGEKMNNMFGSERRDSLPMYKDKPFGYPGSSRRSAWKKKRTVGLVLGTLAGLSWWFGVLSPLSYLSGDGEAKVSSSSPSSSSSWSLFGSSKPTTNWDERAQSVREAFQLSWAGYEKYAWGMFCRLGQRVISIG